jgi:ATP-binding cassette subfamily B protein
VTELPREIQAPTSRTIFRWYVELWRPLRSGLWKLGALTLASAALRVALPTLFEPVIDGSLEWGRPPAGVALALLAVGVLRSIVYGLLQYTRASTNFALGRAARERTFDLLTRLGPDAWARHSTGDLLARLTDDCGEDKMAWFACSGVFRLLEATVVLVFAVTVMATISPRLTLLACLPLPVIALTYRLFAVALDRLYARVQSRVSALEDFLDALFTGIRAVKANGLEERKADRFKELAFALRDSEISAARGQVSVEMLYGYGWQVVLPLLIYAGGRLIVREELSLGAFTSFYGLVLMLVWPALDWGTFFVRLRQAGASVARVIELESLRPEVEPPAEGAPPELGRGLALESVSRSSEDGRRVLLDGVSLSVPAGSTVAIVGEVGSGKSTVQKLLPRIMDPRPGRVSLGGEDLRAVDLAAWRRKVGYVPQEASLISATIEENIRLGRDELTQEDVRRACEVARLTQDLGALPEGLATRIGERGTTLSGGQRQRVAIARALVHEPSVLVLDDVGAALDANTEAALWEGLARLRPGLTKVVATHRSATIERADRVVVLDRGRVADQGTHRELLERCRLYRDLYARAAAADSR